MSRKLCRIAAWLGIAILLLVAVVTIRTVLKPKAIKVAAGGEHSVAIDESGVLWVWGSGLSGQLGLGTREIMQVKPLPLEEKLHFADITAGQYHTVALDEDGEVWAWGDNTYGQLGNGTMQDAEIPSQVANLTNVVAIAAGRNHTVAVRSDGTVWAWGDNTHGQLGTSVIQNAAVPSQIAGLTNVAAVAAGRGHSVALRSDGTVWTWGDNTHGQLGVGKTPGNRVTDLNNVVAIAAGEEHTVALRSDGTVWTWGSNVSGELGIGTFDDQYVPVNVNKLSSVESIQAGWHFTLALQSNGTVWAWGFNGDGELGIGDMTKRKVPIPTQILGLDNVVEIAASHAHSLAIRQDGSIWAWGKGDSGRLGGGALIPRMMDPRSRVCGEYSACLPTPIRVCGF